MCTLTHMHMLPAHAWMHAHTHTHTYALSHRFIHINCLSFSMDEMYLVTSSSTETVHIFRLVEPPSEKYLRPDSTLCQLRVCYLLLCFPSFVLRPAEEQQGWMSYLGKALTTPASYLPSQVRVCVCVCMYRASFRGGGGGGGGGHSPPLGNFVPPLGISTLQN